MASRYFIKKIIYGFGFLAAFFLIAAAIYFLFFRGEPSCFDGRKNQEEFGVDCGGPCEDCEIKRLSPISELWIKHFPAEGGTVIASEIKNSNSGYGADSFSYIIEIFGKNGEKIKTLSKKSFIYAEEARCLFEYVEINPQKIGETKIFFSDAHWARAGVFSQPKTPTRQIITSQKESGDGFQTTGVVMNQNPFSVSKAKIVAFLTNGFGADIAISKTELENMAAFEERQFKIIFPKSVSALDSVNKTRICVEAAR